MANAGFTQFDAHVFRISISESFRGTSPHDIRTRWPFRDLVHALLVVEMHEAMREEEEQKKDG